MQPIILCHIPHPPHIKSLLLITLLASNISGCSLTDHSTGKHHALTPTPPFASDIPQGDDSYSIGFRSGCNDSVGLAGFGAQQFHDPHAAGIFRSTPSKGEGTGYYYDFERALNDPDYNMGYDDGKNHCGYAANAAIGY